MELFGIVCSTYLIEMRSSVVSVKQIAQSIETLKFGEEVATRFSAKRESATTFGCCRNLKALSWLIPDLPGLHSPRPLARNPW